MLIAGNHHLLADAEIFENIAKYLIGGDLASNIAKVENAFT